MSPDNSKPMNPANVPTRGNMTYAALETIRPAQLKMLRYLNRLVGNPPTWEDSCRLILGKDWDGNFNTLSVAAGSWLISELKRGIVAVSQPGDLDFEEQPA